MKAVLVLALLVVAASAAPMPEKRFIESVGHFFQHAVDAVAHTFNQAKDAFTNLTKGLNINFDAVVNQLIPLIDSDMTEGACASTCESAASSVLGPAASLAGSVCGPVCKAALAKIEQAAGK